MGNFIVPSEFIPDVLDRLTAAGASSADRRNAVAMLAPIAAGLDPRSFAANQKSADLAARLALDLTEWYRITRMLKTLGAVRTVQRQGGGYRLALTPHRPNSTRPQGSAGAWA